VPVPEHRRKGNGKFLEITGAAENNLKNIKVKFRSVNSLQLQAFRAPENPRS
jgi:excinuclease UvrABC ATPase subunit